MNPESQREHSAERLPSTEAFAGTHIGNEKSVFEKLNKLGGKEFRALLLMSVLAGGTACTDTEKTGASYTPNVTSEKSPAVDARVHARQQLRIEKAKANVAEARQQHERAQVLADALGIELGDTYNITLHPANGVILSIEGVGVPPEMYTSEEKQKLSFAEKVRTLMEGAGLSETPANTAEKPRVSNAETLESNPVDTSQY